MNFLLEGQRRLRIILNFIVLFGALISFSYRDASFNKTSFFENAMIGLFAPLQRSISYMENKITTVFKNYITNVNASKTNSILQKKVGALEERIFSYDEVIKENKRLKSLLQFGEVSESRKVLAQIISWDASSDFKVLRINKGAKDGIELQNPVVTSKGLVGYIFRLTDNFADILTIMDPSNRVDGIVARIRAHGIVEGYTKDKCIMKYVTRTEPIILNDVILTSGLGNIYPKGLKIGKVTRIERESYGISQYIEISPAVNLDRLEEVVVVIPADNEEKVKEWKALDGEESSRGDKR